MTGSLTGLSPKGPNKYLGPNVYTCNVVTRNRAPTTADYLQPETGKYYPFATLWLVGKNPTTGVYGDLWYLSNIVANAGNWIQFSSGGSGPVLDINVPNGISPVQPNGSGVIAYTSTGGTVTITGSAANTINFDLPGGGFAGVSFPTDSGTATPNSSGVLNLLGQNVAGSGIQTSGSGNTVSHRMISPYDLGNFSFTNNAAATKREVGVFNLDSDPASESRLFSSVSSGSSADPYIQVGIAATMNYCWGIDNSDSDTLKICANANSNSAVPSGGTLLWKMTTGGAASYVSGNLDVTRSQNGANVALTVENQSTTGAAGAIIQARSANGGGNAWFAASDSTQAYGWGVNQSDHTFRITNSNTFTTSGTTLHLLTSSGQPSYPAIGWTNAGVLYSGSAGEILATNAGTAGQVLTSNGPGVAPTYQGAVVSNYTQGTFVPVLSFGGGTTGITYSNQNGVYTRIGNVVNFTIAITLTSKGSSTGVAEISGLPFAISAIPTNNVMSCDLLTFTAGYTYVLGSSSSGTITQLYEYGSGVSPLQLTDVSFANNTSIVISGFYGI